MLCTGTARADIGINLYGASYHFDRDKAKEIGLTNEFNPGLGVRWRKARNEIWITSSTPASTTIRRTIRRSFSAAARCGTPPSACAWAAAWFC